MRLFKNFAKNKADAARVQAARAIVTQSRSLIIEVTTDLSHNAEQAAKKAIAILVTLAGWPPLIHFAYECCNLEYDLPQNSGPEVLSELQETYAKVTCNILLNAIVTPVSLVDLGNMQAVACMMMALAAKAGSSAPITTIALLDHFSGHPLERTNDVEKLGL